MSGRLLGLAPRRRAVPRLVELLGARRRAPGRARAPVRWTGSPTRSSRPGSPGCPCARCSPPASPPRAGAGVVHALGGPIAVCFAAMAAMPRWRSCRRRARRRRTRLRDLWPDAVDNIASGVRAGHGAARGAGAAREPGPEELRGRSAPSPTTTALTGRFHDCLDRLKDRLSDPVGDRSSRACGSPARSAAPTSASCCAPCRLSCARTPGPAPSWRPGSRGRSTPRGSPSPPRGPCWPCCRPTPSRWQAYSTPLGCRRAGRRGRRHRRRLLGDDADRPAARGRAGAAVTGLSRGGPPRARLGVGLVLVWLGLPRHRRRPDLAGRVCRTSRDTPRPHGCSTTPARSGRSGRSPARCCATSPRRWSGSWAAPTPSARASCAPV